MPIKFSALNVDFNSLSPDLLRSRRPAQAGVKDGYPRKNRDFSVFFAICSCDADFKSELRRNGCK